VNEGIRLEAEFLSNLNYFCKYLRIWEYGNLISILFKFIGDDLQIICGFIILAVSEFLSSSLYNEDERRFAGVL